MTDAASAFAGRSVFVTGASGLVGSWLVRTLIAADVRVIALVRDEDPRSEFIRSGDDRRVVQVRGSLENSDLERALVDYEVDVVFHLGAQTQVRHAQRHPVASLELNVRGTYLLLDAIRRLARPVEAVVVASSDKAYGDSDRLPYVEDHPLAGRSVYDASKSAADLIAVAYAESYGLPIAITRCANIYGGGDLNWERIVPEQFDRFCVASDRSSGVTGPSDATTSSSTTPWMPISPRRQPLSKVASTARPSISGTEQGWPSSRWLLQFARRSETSPSPRSSKDTLPMRYRPSGSTRPRRVIGSAGCRGTASGRASTGLCRGIEN